MDCQGKSEKISQQAGEIADQAQEKKEGIMEKARETLATGDEAVTKYTTQATNFLQQTGEQVKNMAQGAAEAVKNSLGINNDSTSSTQTLSSEITSAIPTTDNQESTTIKKD